MSNRAMVSIQANGFSWDIPDVAQGSSSWDAVELVEVFKKDLLTTDVVCMNIQFRSGGWLYLNEDDLPEFTDLISAMSRQWELGDQWYRDVVFPPFETRQVVIRRSSEGKMLLNRMY